MKTGMNRDEWNRWVADKEPKKYRCRLDKCAYAEEMQGRMNRLDCLDCKYYEEDDEESGVTA